MVKIKEALNATVEKLQKAGIDNPRLDARLLIEFATKLRHEELLLNYELEIEENAYNRLSELVLRRSIREPISRILGYKPFWKNEFKVSRETLDPRPDTETVIESVIRHFNKEDKLTILDLGTGSGCILISLLKEFPNAHGVGVDISADAVNTASENASNIGINSDRLQLINANWQNLDLKNPFDIVVSNPPYIKKSDILELEPEVKDYDPVCALDGGKDGFDCYRQITALLPKFLQKGGWVFFEIGYNQEQGVKDILAKGGFFVVETAKDLTGCDRCIVARGGQCSTGV